MNVGCTISTGGDVGGSPAGVRRPVVLVPGNGGVIIRGRHDVEVAIPVHVGDMDIVGTISAGGNVCRGEGERIIGARVVDRDGLARCGGKCGREGRVGGTLVRGRHIIN